MPIKRIKQRLEKIKEQKEWLAKLSVKVRQIREISDILVITPKPIGMNWRGVTNATKSLFGASVLEIPHYYSNAVLTKEQNLELLKLIIELQFNQFIASGIHLYFLELLSEFKVQTGKITGAIFHGALTELHEDNQRVIAFSRLIHLANEGKIDKIGFVKKGLAETVSILTKAKCYSLNLRCTIPSDSRKEKKASGVIKIAIPGSIGFNKNLNNQVAAALMVENSEVHVWGNSHNFDMWELNQRIVNHSHANHEEFLSTLASCDIALYLSFSESWGQIVTECLALGIPCLSSDNNAIFDESPELKNMLVVSFNDNPHLISNKIKELIPLKDTLSPILVEYSYRLDKIALERKAVFLMGNSTSSHLLKKNLE